MPTGAVAGRPGDVDVTAPAVHPARHPADLVVSQGMRVVAVLTALGLVTVACGQTGRTAASGPSSGASTAATSSAPGSPETTSHPAADLQAILLRALTNQHAAQATYDHVLATLGQVAPFPQAASAERLRIAELERVARAHKVAVAPVTAAGSAAPATRAQACQLRVATEKATVALYDELLPQVSAYPDVRLVFHNLRAASQNNHLLAFQRCA